MGQLDSNVQIPTERSKLSSAGKFSESPSTKTSSGMRSMLFDAKLRMVRRLRVDKGRKHRCVAVQVAFRI
jgi:hypothetical protein